MTNESALCGAKTFSKKIPVESLLNGYLRYIESGYECPSSTGNG